MKNAEKTVVVARSAESGVWIGEELSRHETEKGFTVELANACRIWSWEGALSCSGIAAEGITSGKVDIPVTVSVFGCCELVQSTWDILTQTANIAANREE